MKSPREGQDPLGRLEWASEEDCERIKDGRTHGVERQGQGFRREKSIQQ